MQISRTPFRISFFGGGSDYSSWYKKHGGAVLSTTINKYCYITSRYLPPFFPNKSRMVWNRIEEVMDNFDIQHPAVRACLQHLNITEGIEIHTTGDLPARSGLGSSSTFTVGLLNVLSIMQGKSFNKAGLALEAIHLERDVMKENVGIQDQVIAAYGGFNKTTINNDGGWFIEPIRLPYERLTELENHLMLFFTGISRSASAIAAEQVSLQASGQKDTQLHRMREMVDTAIGILKYDIDIKEFGNLLHESWMLKRTLAKNISPQFVDDIYEKARKAGAIGGKLLGAGGGGFMLLFASPENHEAIRKSLYDLTYVPFKFENEGSKIIYGL